jgi:regulator of sirC expression with transglutaminase-like and TPR domain
MSEATAVPARDGARHPAHHPGRRHFIRGAACLAAPLLPAAARASPDTDRLLTLPEHKVNIGLAALTFAKEIYLDLDVAAYDGKIDDLAGQAGRQVALHRATKPDDIIRTLNTFFYKQWGVRYDDDPKSSRKVANFFINGILDTRTGICQTIPMLYLAVAQRLGYPVYAVFAPEHQFLRWVDPNLVEQNIELSGGAGYSPDDDYAFRLNISDKARRNGAYLRTVTHREYLGNLLQQNALVFAQHRQYDRAIDYFEKARRISPKDVYYTRNLGAMWEQKARHTLDSAEARRYRAMATKYVDLANDMGWTQDPDANTRRKS